MKNDIHARHSRTGNVTAEDSHDSLITCDTTLYKISNFELILM